MCGKVKNLIFILCLLFAPMLAAEQGSDEASLIRSWGFDLTEKGTLIFNSSREQGLEYRPWSPDLSKFKRLTPARKPPVVLDPLIISAKSKNKE